jgi:hypothetical protein
MVIVRLLAQRELRLKLARFTDDPEELSISYKRESLRDMYREPGIWALRCLDREARVGWIWAVHLILLHLIAGGLGSHGHCTRIGNGRRSSVLRTVRILKGLEVGTLMEL